MEKKNAERKRTQYNIMKVISIDKNANHSTLFNVVYVELIDPFVLDYNCGDDHLMLPAFSQALEHSKADFRVTNVIPRIE